MMVRVRVGRKRQLELLEERGNNNEEESSISYYVCLAPTGTGV